jgi:hypothetical protein
LRNYVNPFRKFLTLARVSGEWMSALTKSPHASGRGAMDTISETTRPTGTADPAPGAIMETQMVPYPSPSQPHRAARQWRRGKPCPHIRTRCKTCSQKQQPTHSIHVEPETTVTSASRMTTYRMPSCAPTVRAPAPIVQIKTFKSKGRRGSCGRPCRRQSPRLLNRLPPGSRARRRG